MVRRTGNQSGDQADKSGKEKTKAKSGKNSKTPKPGTLNTRGKLLECLADIGYKDGLAQREGNTQTKYTRKGG